MEEKRASLNTYRYLIDSTWCDVAHSAFFFCLSSYGVYAAVAIVYTPAGRCTAIYLPSVKTLDRIDYQYALRDAI